MATETKRVVYLKRLIDPNDPDPSNPTNYIDIPVIYSITFLDANRGQRYNRTFNNSLANNTRSVHTHTVSNQTISGGTFTADDSNSVDVERIDTLKIVNADWHSSWKLNNQDPAPLMAPTDPAFDHTAQGHYKTHVVRYNKDNVNDPDSTPWVDVELVDILKLKGAKKQRGNSTQVRYYYVDGNDPGVALGDSTDPFNPTWADITFHQTTGTLPSDTNGNPAPVRLDPLQNIVNVNWSNGLAVQFFVKDLSE